MPFFSPARPAANPVPEFLHNVWKNLATQTGQADPVCCGPEWNLAYYETATPTAPVFYLSSPDSLILFTIINGASGEPLIMPMENGWMFAHPLLGQDAPNLLAEAIPQFRLKFPEGLPLIFLGGWQSGSIQAKSLINKFGREFEFLRLQKSIQCGASLEGGLDGWLSRRSANHRGKLRKGMRKALKEGITFEKVRPNNGVHAQQVFSRMLKVEAASWKGIGHCGMAEPPAAQFYAALVRRLAESRSVFIIFAKMDDRDIGYIFGGIAGGIFRGQQFSYSQEYASYSPGNLMQMEMAAWLCEEKIDRYDMGPLTGPRMEYKSHWTELHFPMETVVMRPL